MNEIKTLKELKKIKLKDITLSDLFLYEMYTSGKCENLKQENIELRETLEIMSDKKLMKRIMSKSKGKNIPLKEMKQRLKKH